MKKNKTTIELGLYLTLIAFTIVNCGCKKLVTVDEPITSSNDKTVFASDADATSVLTNLYIGMSEGGITATGSLMSLSLYAGLSADELDVYPGVNAPAIIAHYENDLVNTIPGLPNYWSTPYNFIYVANAAIDGLSASVSLTPSVKSQLLGEAYFMRAFCYFYLVNLYGDVPLNLSTDYQLNSKRPRTPRSEVEVQIISDLKMAQSLLGTDYVNSKHIGTTERARPNKYAATAMLARVLLYTGDNVNAEIEANKVISSADLYKIENVENVFVKESKEIIWAIQPIYAFGSTSDAVYFKPDEVDLSAPQFGFQVHLSQDLLGEMSANDNRKTAWIGKAELLGIDYCYPNKYKNDDVNSLATEYTIVLRLAEQYLIRAEARARQGKISGSNSAESDLNVIRERAGLSGTTAIGSESLMIDAILKERRFELFTEWGHRWLDLKRLHKADLVLGAKKGLNWQSSDQFYPIPKEEMDRNPGMNASRP